MDRKLMLIAMYFAALGSVIGLMAGLMITTNDSSGVQTLTEKPTVADHLLPWPAVRDSPKARVSQNDIWVQSDKVVIRLDNPEWATFTDTHSMEPVLNFGAKAIQIVPKSPDEISVGDIISFKYGNDVIIHRVIAIGSDDLGWYALTKGDNNPSNDPLQVRFSDVKKILVAIIY